LIEKEFTMRHILARLCFVVPLLTATVSGINSAQAQVLGNLFEDATFGPRAGVHYQSEENGGDPFTDARLFVPFGDEELMIFGDTRMIVDRQGEFGYNLGLGARGAIGTESMWGANIFADRRRTSFGTYNQIGFGWELVLEGVEVRNNFYYPVNNDREVISESLVGVGVTPGTDPFFEQNYLKAEVTNTLLQYYEQALEGLDFEVGSVLYADEDIAVRGYIGGYFFDNPGLTDATGISGRLNVIVRDNIEVNGFVQHDRFFDTNGGAAITLYLGGGSTAENVSDQVRRVMGRPVYRRQMITAAQGTLIRTEDLGVLCLTNPDTTNPLTITHVDSAAPMGGDGTFENPFNALPATQGTDIVYLYSDSTFDMQSYTLAASQRLLGEGNGFVHLVDTVEAGTVVLPDGNGSGGAKPVISNSTGAGIVMADNSEVANVSIVDPSTFGIFAENTTGGLVNSVMISTSGNGDDGVRTENSSLQILDSMITTSGSFAQGVNAFGSSHISFDNTSIMIEGSSWGMILQDSSVAELLNGSSITLGNISSGGGVFARDTSHFTMDASSIAVTGDGARGILSRDSSVIDVLNGSSIMTSGNGGAFGIQAIDSGISMVTVANSSITTMGNFADAVLARGNRRVSITDSSLSTVGQDAEGIAALDNSRVILDNTSVQTDGMSARGVFADQTAQVELLNGSSVTLGTMNESVGVGALGSSRITIDNSSVLTTGMNAEGVAAVANSVIEILNGSSITTTGPGPLANGVVAFADSMIMIDASSVSTMGDNCQGVIATGNSLVEVLNGSTITTSGEGAHGVLASTDGILTVDGSSIATTGDNSVGGFATGNGILKVLNGTSIVTEGMNAHGISANNSGTAMVDGSSIVTTGDGAQGIRGIVNSTVTVNNSSVSTAGTDAHGIFASGIDLTVTGGSEVTATGMDADALRFFGAGGETNTLLALESVFSSTSGAGIYVETLNAMSTIDATILANTIDSADMLNSDVDIVLDNSDSGTLTIFGADDEIDLRDVKNSADTIFTDGTIMYMP
jgi:hypothetical protein